MSAAPTAQDEETTEALDDVVNPTGEDASTGPKYAYLEPVKEILDELGFEEVKDDGWGFRVEAGGGPLGAPGPIGAVVTVEKASHGPLPTPRKR